MATDPTTNKAEARLLDLRGLRCPWPALRVARALREDETPVLAVADDPAAEKEISALAAENGWHLSYVQSLIGPGFLLLAQSVK